VCKNNDWKAANLSSATKHMYIIVWQYYETENLNMNGANGGIFYSSQPEASHFLFHVISLKTNFITLY